MNFRVSRPHNQPELRLVPLSLPNKHPASYLKQCTGAAAPASCFQKAASKTARDRSHPNCRITRGVRSALLELVRTECNQRPRFEVYHEELDDTSPSGASAFLDPNGEDEEHPDIIPLVYFEPASFKDAHKHYLINTPEQRYNSFSIWKPKPPQRRLSLVV